jgi:acyl carrier protein
MPLNLTVSIIKTIREVEMKENLAKYKRAFGESFESIDSTTIYEELAYESIIEWDSVGHMGLMAELEETFNIQLAMDDVIDFSSFTKGIEVLARYKIII